MTITRAEQFLIDGYPALRVEVDGREAILGPDAKPAIHAAGLVYLGGEFEGSVPPIEIRPADGGPLKLEGFSRDARLHRLYDGFLRAIGDGTFAAGPVAIPA